MFLYGKAICYQGYREGQSPILGVYPTKDQILEDLLILDKEFDYIRLYDTSIHTKDILEVISEFKINIKVMLSMYLFVEENHISHPFFNKIDRDILEKNILKNNSLCKEVIGIANRFGDVIFSISVGNEARSTWNVNRVSDKRISELVKKIQKEVSQPVTFCEEWKYWLTDLPLTADAVDFISIHSYPVWNAVDIDSAITETNRHFNLVRNKYPNKYIIITEAGWPTNTDENKIPKEWATISNQTKYCQEICEWAEQNKTLAFVFEAFDELWKGSLNPSDPEKNWGLYYDDRSKKDGLYIMDKILFTSKRCIIRAFIESDIDDFVLYRNNEEWMQYQSFKGLTKEEYKKILLKEANLETGAQYAIVDKSNNRLIGDIYLKKENNCFWVGYTISPDYKRQGYAYEVLIAAISWIKDIGNAKIMAGVEQGNIPSISLLEKTGFMYLKEEDGELIYSLNENSLD